MVNYEKEGNKCSAFGEEKDVRKCPLVVVEANTHSFANGANIKPTFRR